MIINYEEYLVGILIKCFECVCFVIISFIFLVDLIGLVGVDLSFVELGIGFKLDFLVFEVWIVILVFGFWVDCVFFRFGGFFVGFRCMWFFLRSLLFILILYE